MKEVKNSQVAKNSKAEKSTTKGDHKTAIKEASPEHTSWDDQKKKLKAKFSTLTDADLNFEENKKEEMMKKVQAKLGKTREELAKIVAAL